MKESLKKFLKNQFSISFDSSDVDENTNLFMEGFIDSFGLIELVTFLEAEFNIKISDEDLIDPKMTSFKGIVEIVEKQMANPVLGELSQAGK